MTVRAGSAALLGAVFACDCRRTVRIRHALGETPVWFGGVPVADGDRVDMEPGAYALIALFKAGTKPPRLSLSLVDSTDHRDLAAWQEALRQAKPILERLLALKPDSDLAARARALLKGG